MLDKVSIGPGARINYDYTLINYSSNDIDKIKIHDNFLTKVRSDICGNDDMKKFLQYGGIYAYSYYGNDGVSTITIDSNNADCAYDRIQSNFRFLLFRNHQIINRMIGNLL